MPRTFIGEDFLPGIITAREPYRRHAAPQPILDFHNHPPPAQIAQNHQFGGLHEMRLAGDHYEWRATRANVAERLCSDAADSVHKFRAWTFPPDGAFAVDRPRAFNAWLELEAIASPLDLALLGARAGEIRVENACRFFGFDLRAVVLQ